MSSPPSFSLKLAAYGVHVFTASGIIFAFLATAELFAPQPRANLVFLYLMLTTMIDAIDGTFARLFRVKVNAPRINGRTIDDILDYLTFTFIPLLLVWRMDWLPFAETGWDSALIVAAMLASLLGFGNIGAKDEENGFFLGFPSYWNVYAFYAGLSHHFFGPWPGGVLVAILAILTIVPVRFVYPNLAPKPWRLPVLAGAGIWLIIMLAMLPNYPRVSAWLALLSLVYPVFYTVLSIVLHLRVRARLRRHTRFSDHA